MKKINDVLQAGLAEFQPEFPDFDILETEENPPGHFQIKIHLGDTVSKLNEAVRYRVFANGITDPLAYRLFNCFVSCFHSRKDKEFIPAQVAVTDFMPWYDGSVTHRTRVKQAMRALKGLMIECDYSNNDCDVDNLIVGPVRYSDSKKIITAELNPRLKGYFLLLYQNYTTYGLLEFNGLKTFYTQRLFEIGCSVNVSEVFLLENLQRMLDINEFRAPSLLRYADFKRRVLEPAKKEINAKTNLKFDYEAIRLGRSIGKIKIKARRMDKQADILA